MWREKENDFFNTIFLPWVLKESHNQTSDFFVFSSGSWDGRKVEGLTISHLN